MADQAKPKVDQDIEDVVTGLGFKKAERAKVKEEIKKLRAAAPDAYNELRYELSKMEPMQHINARVNLTQQILAKHALRKEYYATAQNVCTAFAALGRISDSQTMIKTAAVASQAVTIYKQINVMHQVMQANNGLMGAMQAAPMAIVNPVLGICMADLVSLVALWIARTMV